MLPGMRASLVALAIVFLAIGCDSKKSSKEQPAAVEQKPAARAPLADLTTASGLGAVRTAFDAHKGEARFLTLLSPT